jgi:hypothetical protein
MICVLPEKKELTMSSRLFVFGFLVVSFLLISGIYIQSNILIADKNTAKTECPFLQGKAEKTFPYPEGKVNSSDSECPYLSGKITCPYRGKKSKTETETSNKGKSKEIKFYEP